MNLIPVAATSTGELDEDTAVTSRVSATDPEGSAVEYVVAYPPNFGELHLDRATGEFTYSPAQDFNGTDVFLFRAWDGERYSDPAQVVLTVHPVNDPLVAHDAGAQHNSAYSQSTWIPLPIADVDGDMLGLEILADDPAVATASLDDGYLRITPTGRGSTTIRVSAVDSESVARTEFSFEVGDVTREAVVAPLPQEPSVIELRNEADRLVTFTLTYNGNESFASPAAAAGHVAAMVPEYPDEPFSRKLWRFVRDNTYHNVPLSADYMWNDMWSTLNSTGWGFCSNVSAVYVEIARAAGYEARVWGLNGHVVPEIYWNGRWEMYDPDLSAYYLDRSGNVAGVQQLAQDPTLITAPTNPVLPSDAARNDGPYRAVVADIYATTSNNYIDTNRTFATRLPSGSTMIALPGGSRLSLAGRWTANPVGYDGTVPYVVPEYRQAALQLQAGWVGDLTMPWVLWDIQGGGSVRIGDRDFSTDDPALRAFLQAPGAAITSLQVLSNTDGLRLIFLINAMWYDVLPSNDVSVTGLDVWAVTMGATAVPAEVSTGVFPDHYRKPVAASAL